MTRRIDPQTGLVESKEMRTAGRLAKHRALVPTITTILFFTAWVGCTTTGGRSSGPGMSAHPNAAEMAVPLSSADLDVARIRTAIFHETNAVRRELGLKPFQPLALLDEAADLQASSNALNQSASHFNIIRAWATPYERVKSLGLKPSLVSENAALLPLINIDPANGHIERTTSGGTTIINQATRDAPLPHTYASFAQAIVRAWMNSPGHRANIVHPEFRYMGCSARPTRGVAGAELITGIQVFYAPIGG
jgi:uncharacterized protein YkwD